jgi:PAS domain S-box-containing protein
MSPTSLDPPVAADEQALAIIDAITDVGLLYSSVIDQLLPKLIRPLLEILDLSGGAILLYDHDAKLLHLAAVQHRLAADQAGQRVDSLWQQPLLDQTRELALQAAQAGRMLSGPQPDSAPALHRVLERLDIAELVSVPLLAGGWLTGVFQVAALPGVSIAPRQMRILQVVTRQMAVTIENARLFTQTRAEQERTRAVVDATNDAILMLDERWRPMLVNRRARFFFGFSEHELLGREYAQLEAALVRIFEHGERFGAWLAAQLRSPGARAVAEFRLLQPDPRLLQCFTAPVMDVHERILGRILVFRDMTREREVERMKNDFVATVSHELRTPLTSIQGALQLVLGQPQLRRTGLGGELPPRARELLTISLSNTERLMRLISDILDVARIEQGRIQFQRKPLRPAALGDAAAAEVQALAATRLVRVELDIPDRLPDVYADQDRAVQILVNLLSNAIKFSSQGQRVLLSARHEGKQVIFTVRDWGRGIALEDQHRLFQKFQQIDNSTTRATGGTGLGLSICKALVEEHGGRIWLTSTPNEGSSFSFTLPIADPPVLPSQRQVTIGLIAVDADRRNLLRAALDTTGYRVQVLTGLAPEDVGQAGVAVVVVDVASAQGPEVVLLNQLRSDPATQALSVLVLADAHIVTPHDMVKLPRTTPPYALAVQAQQLLEHPQPLVLVVDDDRLVRPLLVRLIRRQGLRVLSAADGHQALGLAANYQPDVILLDIEMPDLNGYEVLQRLAQNALTAHVPVIILTGNEPVDQQNARGDAPHVAAYLEKPVAAERLIGAIMHVIKRNERADGAPSA